MTDSEIRAACLQMPIDDLRGLINDIGIRSLGAGARELSRRYLEIALEVQAERAELPAPAPKRAP